MNDTRLIAFEDVRELFNIPAGNEAHWDGNEIWPPYELRTDGIYAKPAFRLEEYSPGEREALRPWFPPESYGKYAIPVCPLPCDGDTFVRFVEGAQMWDRVTYFAGSDEDGNLLGELTETWVSLGLPTRRPVTETGPSAPTAGRKHPPYLKPVELAKAFNGLNDWGVDAWKRNLSDPPGWIKPARIETPGKGRTNPNLWNPLELAKCLMHHDPKTDLKELDRRFKTRPELSAWRGEWETGPGALID